jgi:hypothetical protein
MANFTAQYVIFEGSRVGEVMEAFSDASEREQKENKGQWIIESEFTSALFSIEVSDETEGEVRFLTKYNPDLFQLGLIAQQYNVTFKCFYEDEMQNYVGYAEYKGGQLHDFFLDDSEIKSHITSVDYVHTYNGKGYESYAEAVEKVLYDKVRNESEGEITFDI